MNISHAPIQTCGDGLSSKARVVLDIVTLPSDNTHSPEDRADHVARIQARAEDVFGEPEKAALWLNRQNRLLNDQTPLEAIQTDTGLQLVMTILGRIEHGVYS